MPGPTPKPAATRQRRNRTSTAATLPSAESAAGNDVPDLPPRVDEGGNPTGWHPKVVEWWASVWTSPMASEFLDSDMRGGLYELALLREDFWTATSRTGRLEVAKEIRLQDVRFGLDTISRRRLQWEIEKGDQAAERTQARRERKAPDRSKADPRMRLVS